MNELDQLQKQLFVTLDAYKDIPLASIIGVIEMVKIDYLHKHLHPQGRSFQKIQQLPEVINQRKKVMNERVLTQPKPDQSPKQEGD